MEVTPCHPNGNLTALLYGTIRPHLMRVALRVTENHADAEDAVQDVFLAMLETKTRPARLRAYLAVAVRNRAVSTVRARRKAIQLIETLAQVKPVAAFNTQPEACLARLVMAAGGDRRLPIIWLGIADGRSYREIGTELEMTPDAIKSLLYRSRKWLRRFGPDGGAR